MEQHDNSHHDHDGITEDREQRPPVYFNVLFFGLIIWGVAFMAFYLLSGWSSEAEFEQKMAAHQGQPQQQSVASASEPAKEQPAEKTETAAVQPDGAALYVQRCAMCHGADAKGGMGPDLTAAEYIYGKSPEVIKESISAGRNNGMPAFGNQFSEAEIQALVDYLTAL